MTLARISWNLPPRPLLDARYAPSRWRVYKALALLAVTLILGRPPLADFLAAPDRFHRVMADPPRKRKGQVPILALT